MTDKCGLSKIASHKKTRQFMGFALVLFGLNLAAPPRLWGQCTQGVASLTFSPGSITALAADPEGSTTGTVTLNCVSMYQGTLVNISVSPADGVLSCGPGAVPAGGTQGTLSCSAVQGSGAYTVTASIDGMNQTASASVGVTALIAHVSMSPSSIVGGNGQQATFTVTTNAPVRSIPPYIGQTYSTVQNSCNVSAGVNARIWPGTSSETGTLTANAVSQPTLCNFTISNYIWGGPTASVSLMVLPAAGTVASPADSGPCKQCQQQAGAPVNVTNGNVWIQQRDYSVPGLGGGLNLARTWNSLWAQSNPPVLAGMFGLGWQSTYEEQLSVVDGQTLRYWRADGSGWTFTYNSSLGSYSVASPPDERAQIVSNASGGFTLTLSDGTQKVFNSQNLLSSIIDRNGNQTTIAYDTYNRVSSATVAGGSTFTFNYGNANEFLQATSVQDSVGVIATYTYDSSSRLTQVTYADASTLNFTYDPNSSMILSVTDGQGKLLESHTYDSQNRGLTSARAYGVDSVSLTY